MVNTIANVFVNYISLWQRYLKGRGLLIVVFLAEEYALSKKIYTTPSPCAILEFLIIDVTGNSSSSSCLLHPRLWYGMRWFVLNRGTSSIYYN